MTDSAEQGNHPTRRPETVSIPDPDRLREDAPEPGEAPRRPQRRRIPRATDERGAPSGRPRERAARSATAEMPSVPTRAGDTTTVGDGAPPSTTAARADGFPLWPDGGGAPPPAAATETVVIPPVSDAAWPTPQMRPGRPALGTPDDGRPRRRRAKLPRPPAVGLAMLLLFGLLASFFAWVSADPFWVAMGHAERGTATVTRCTGKGLTTSCIASFRADGFATGRVRLSGVDKADRRAGARVTARMVTPKSRIAYAGPPGPLHVRWSLGVVLVLLCGLGIAWGAGANRLRGHRAALYAYVTSISAPVVLLVGILAATF